MSEKILAICQSCAEHNNAEWKGRANAPMFQGRCDCCKKVKPLTAIQYWRGIKPEDDLKPAPECENTLEEVGVIAPKEAAPKEAAPKTTNKPAANKSNTILGKK